MRKARLLVYCLTVLIFIQGQDSFIFSKQKECPNIQFEEKTYDFGIAGQQEKIVHIFSFVNTGEGTLTIKAVKTSCGCVATLLSNQEVRPGETGVIEVNFETRKYKGEKVETIHVYSNDPDEPEVELKISGVIKTDVAVEPESLYLGNIEKGKTISKTVKLIQIDERELVLNRVEVAKEYFLTDVSRFKDKRHKGFRIDVVLKPDAPLGQFSEIITLHTNLSKRPRIDVPICGTILGRIRVKPQIVSLGTLKKGSLAANKIKVTSADKEKYNILRVTSDPPFFTTEVTRAKNNREFQITIRVNENAPAGNVVGKIHIYTDDPEQSLIKVPVYGLITNIDDVGDVPMKSPPGTGASQDNGHVYVTRVPVEEDTFVATWLIKRFLDRKAEFVFLGSGDPIPEISGTLFDLPSARARWRRTHGRCTSEHLLVDIKAPDPAMKSIVALVRKLEMGRWLVSPSSDAGRLRSSILKITEGITDPKKRTYRVFTYLDDVYAAGGKVP